MAQTVKTQKELDQEQRDPPQKKKVRRALESTGQFSEQQVRELTDAIVTEIDKPE